MGERHIDIVREMMTKVKSADCDISVKLNHEADRRRFETKDRGYHQPN